MIETTEQALLNTILANPDDEAPRLVYADWLGRVFGHYLTPHGITVQLPSTLV